MQNYKVSYENWCNISAKMSYLHFHYRSDYYQFHNYTIEKRVIQLG